jgi:hypothetical protein
MNTNQRWLEKEVNRWKNPSWWNLLVCLPLALGLVRCLDLWNFDRTVASRERSVPGFVTVHDTENHNRYSYSFVVDGKSYTGWEIPQYTEPALGQQVLVHYDPVNPENNALTDFEELTSRSLGPVPILGVGIGAVAAAIFIRRRQFKKSQRMAKPA